MERRRMVVYQESVEAKSFLVVPLKYSRLIVIMVP